MTRRPKHEFSTVAMDTLVRDRTRAFVIAGIGLCGLTLAVLASAARRLRLYQEAYGWTELRFYVAAAIGWLGVCLVVAIACLATPVHLGRTTQVWDAEVTLEGTETRIALFRCTQMLLWPK